MEQKFDIAIIGGGIGGLMAAYKLKKESPEKSVIILERGFDQEKRFCPAGKNGYAFHNGHPCCRKHGLVS